MLYVVSTPIGHLGDMTFRAVGVLTSAALVVAEDTRHSRTLLDHYHIRTPMMAYHEHNEARETPRLIARMQAGESIALITDAGTPLVSDPGARLVRAAIDAGIPVVPVPGASALLAALVVSGLSADRFTFVGFPPRKGKERVQTIVDVVRSPITTVLYEAPNRVADTLAELRDAGAAERQAVVARELTKKFEEIARGSVTELAGRFAEDVRGEVVILVAGAPPVEVSEAKVVERIEQLRQESAGITTREIVDRVTAELGVARNLVYRLAHGNDQGD